GANLACNASHFTGEYVELINHCIDGLFQLQDFAAGVYGNLFGEIPARNGRRHFSDVTDLRGEITRHEVDVVGQVFPGTGHARHLCLAAEFAFGADFAGDACHFRREGVELVHHRIDGVLEFENFAVHVHGDLSGQVAARHCGCNLRDVTNLTRQVAAHGI